jgi:di/tricarboxylate transporter
VYYSVANADVFTVRFFEEAAIRRVHLPPPAMNDSMPEYENTQIIGEVLPGGSASSVEDQQKCLALLVLVCILWATDAIPLWVTSLLIPLIVVLDNIILGAETDSGHFVPVPAQKTATAQLANLANPNVILLMGGFSMAAALHKFDLDSRLAMAILSRSGDNPRVFILINMVVGFVISMFCNNVAAPVLCFFLVSPVLQRVSKEDRSYCQCMIMSIAFACNIGGMPTPIASPQNTAALLAINQQVLLRRPCFAFAIGTLFWVGRPCPVCKGCSISRG